MKKLLVLIFLFLSFISNLTKAEILVFVHGYDSSSSVWRNTGIFKKLVDEIKNLAKEKDVDIIRLYVHNENKNAMKVYEKLGMKKNYTVYEVI